MEFTVTCSVQNGRITAKIDAPQATPSTAYAYYLYDNSKGIVDKRMYIPQSEVTFSPQTSGVYYVRGFVRISGSGESAPVVEAKNSNKVFYYPRKTIPYEDLEQAELPSGYPVICDILWNGVHFEFFLNAKPGNDRAVVLGTGTVKDLSNLPMFNRASWAPYISATVIGYSDPTLYLGEDCHLGWGYGTKDRWYLKDIAYLLRKLLKKLDIKPEDTLFYGSSGGGFMSLCLAAMLRGKASVINPQLIVKNYHFAVLEKLRTVCLGAEEQLDFSRLNVLSVFQQEGYIPKCHIIENTESQRDLTLQLTPFLASLYNCGLDCSGRITVDLYTAEGGHSAMPDKESCLREISDWLSPGGMTALR